MLSKLILQLFNKKKWERICQKDHTVLFVELLLRLKGTKQVDTKE